MATLCYAESCRQRNVNIGIKINNVPIVGVRQNSRERPVRRPVAHVSAYHSTLCPASRPVALRQKKLELSFN